MPSEPTFAYIVVGAGSAGCVVASRLSEDPDVNVLLLEAGGPDTRPEIHAEDLDSLFALWRSDWAPTIDWGYVSEDEPGLGGRRIPVARGRVLGGSSSVNALMYVRGNRRDFDTWNYLGNRGWSYQHVLPYFKRSEDYEGGASEYRGAGGPLSVVNHADPTPVAQAFVAAAQELGYGGPDNDYNAAKQEDTAFFYQSTKTRGRKRCSTSVAFLEPARGRANLTVDVGARVTRLLVEGRRVVGVEYVQGGQTRRVRAEREVVVSSGAFESPKLLMLSGIGPAAHLRTHGIQVLVDLPGVGENLQDHLFVGLCYQCRREHPRATLVSEAGLFTRTEEGLESAAPDVQFTFGSAKFLLDGAPAWKQEGPGFTFAPVGIRPQSAGRVTLRSGDWQDVASVRFNYLQADADVTVLVRGIQLGRELAQARAFDDLRGEELSPGPEVTSDDDLRQFVRAGATTLWHPVGTCRMGADAGAVVDDELRVHGVDGLRVADASVMPAIVAGNTNAASIMIGERAAAMLQGQPAPELASPGRSARTL